jgi:signal transduction histidine kinase
MSTSEPNAPGVWPAALDLGLFNRWFNVARLSGAAGAAVAIVVVESLRAGRFDLVPALVLCSLVAVGSLDGLAYARRRDRSRLFLALEIGVDLTLVTAGVALAPPGLPAILLRSLFLLVIAPVCLVSLRGGLATIALATCAHLVLLVADRGWSTGVLFSIEALVPPVVFCLVAQQCFFYGRHLSEKNQRLADLAIELEGHRHELMNEVRTEATLVDIARALSTTLDATELLARVTRTMIDYLRADWGATFLVDPDGRYFRIVAVTDPDIPLAELASVAFPVDGWSVFARLADEPLVLLSDADASQVRAIFTGGRVLEKMHVAGVHRGGRLVGFLAVGYEGGVAEPSAVQRLVAGVAEHAATVLQHVRLLEELQLAAARKSEFVDAVSHELRSPLNVIIGYAEMLRDGGLGDVTPAQASALERTHRQAVTLLEMITSLLDLNRLEGGRLPITTEPIVLHELLTELLEELPAAWRRPGVSLRTAATARLPVITTDRGKLKTILRNLLHNALKFTAAGEVVVRGALAGDAVTLTVRDTGAGIPADALPYVFEMFRQAPGATGGGVGLGLHIVRRFVDALGGTVSVASTVNVGTSFVVTLPCSPDPSGGAV